jgi:hypothetical protein
MTAEVTVETESVVGEQGEQTNSNSISQRTLERKVSKY